jgi:hypothetical protein
MFLLLKIFIINIDWFILKQIIFLIILLKKIFIHFSVFIKKKKYFFSKFIKDYLACICNITHNN